MRRLTIQTSMALVIQTAIFLAAVRSRISGYGRARYSL